MKVDTLITLKYYFLKEEEKRYAHKFRWLKDTH